MLFKEIIDDTEVLMWLAIWELFSKKYDLIGMKL